MADANYEEAMNAEHVSTMKETDRKCPDCGATMDFDPKTGGLYCQYCGHREDIKAENTQGESVASEQDFESAEFTGNCDWGVAQKTVTCKSCGAVSVYDACRDSHLLFVGPLLSGPRALAALLLDSHHEAPMLSWSLAARRPGATGSQGHSHSPPPTTDLAARGLSPQKRALKRVRIRRLRLEH